MNKIDVELKIKPLSINQCFQGRRYKTRNYDDYIKEFLILLPKKTQIKGEIGIKMMFWLQNSKRCDLDNLCKPILDILVKKGYIQDDRAVQEIYLKKVKSEIDNISIQIYQLNQNYGISKIHRSRAVSVQTKR